jgi:hypothetical protein
MSASRTATQILQVVAKVLPLCGCPFRYAARSKAGKMLVDFDSCIRSIVAMDIHVSVICRFNVLLYGLQRYARTWVTFLRLFLFASFMS